MEPGAMTSARGASGIRAAIRLAGAFVLAIVVVNGCRSGLRVQGLGDAAAGSGGFDANPDHGPSAGGGSGGTAGAGAEVAPPARDAGPGSSSGGNGTGGGSGGGGSAGAGGTPVDCSDLVAKIASQTQILGTCTAVVRLDWTSLKIISHAFVCGKYAPTDETAARASASAAAVFPYASGAGQGTLISGPVPQDEWVFRQSPTDFGGAAAVSARSGLTVFAGSIVWAGMGDIMLPAAWDETDLGSGCASPTGVTVRGFDLASGRATESVTAPANVVLATALPSAFAQWGSIFDIVVLSYPRTIGNFDPSTAEYIVLVNAGWLE
jgi:hypothetical protein